MTDFYRKQIRLDGYDYATDGYYYVTICTAEKACMLGWIDAESSMRLSETGTAVLSALRRLPDMFPGAAVPAYVIMPNHLHLILRLTDSEKSLSQIINCLKGLVSKQAQRPIWQKSFYDHIIRNEADYCRIAAYIEENPRRWVHDDYYIPQTEDAGGE